MLYTFWCKIAIMLGIFLMLLLSSTDLFPNKRFQTENSGTSSVFLTVWIKIRTDALSVLHLVQNVGKVYQQTAKVAARISWSFSLLFNVQNIQVLPLTSYSNETLRKPVFFMEKNRIEHRSAVQQKIAISPAKFHARC